MGSSLNSVRPSSRRGFTLVELLVVVALMGLLLGLTLPAFQSMGRGSGMKSAVTQLSSTLSLARQHAITKRVPVYVVFPRADSTLFPAAFNNDRFKATRAYGVFAVTNQANFNAGNAGAGRYVSEWYYLPPGVVFDFSTGTKNQSVFNNSTLVNNIPLPSDGNRQRLHAIRFNPDGSMRAGSGSAFVAEIDVAEGWANVVTNSSPWSWDYGVRQNGMRVVVELSTLTGGQKVRYY